MKALFIITTALFCLSCNADEVAIAYPSDPQAGYSIVSVEGVWPRRISVLKIAREEFTTYVKREFDCLNSRVRYLGSSNNPELFSQNQEDKYSSPANITLLTSILFSKTCKGFVAASR
ncbi:hypothetical protein [Pseudomonas sp. MYb118]|uniref:hypothetical protein n=1 Tax=Pseudomonas sp. MYb118 TaxID=1848720 RepID=UPI0034CD59B4